VVLRAALGCDSIWLGGISLGGFVALAYAERYPQEIDGLCLFAPYLGNHMVTGEIERANGVHEWTPGELAEDDDERRIWRFIKEQRAASTAALGYGRGSFRREPSDDGVALAPESVDVVPGGHEWPSGCGSGRISSLRGFQRAPHDIAKIMSESVIHRPRPGDPRRSSAARWVECRCRRRNGG